MAELELLGVIYGDGCLEGFGQTVVDSPEAFQQILGFVLPAGEEEDRGAVPEEHEPEGVGDDEPGEAQLAGFEDDDLGVPGDGAEGVLLGGPEVEGDPATAGRIFDMAEVFDEMGGGNGAPGDGFRLHPGWPPASLRPI